MTVQALSGTLPTEQDITVTLTASGDAVVTLVLTPDEIVEGGTSTVTATIEEASSSPFSVEVKVVGDANTRKFEPSTSRVLFFAEGSTTSSGAPVTITSGRDNVYTGKQTLTVSGVLIPADDDMTVPSVKLTVTDDDEGPGQVRLRLSKSQIQESNDGTTNPVLENVTILTAEVVGGDSVRPGSHAYGGSRIQ